MGGGGGGESTESAVVPRASLDAVGDTLAAVDELQSHLRQALALADPDVLAELPPLHRARAFLVLARAASTLVQVRLRCDGIRSDQHPIEKELDRLTLYQEKLGRYDDWSNAPLRPSARLNSQAATRFIGHSLPDLTPEQRKNLQDLSRGNFVRRPPYHNRAKKKHKPNKQSARAAAQEFLEKAARELLFACEPGVKGPLQVTADQDDD
ncbi:nuclear nucleic acid-binding protein C1D-like [Zingiber officinale]|uniref:Nuclear nucleic acid-binding protein C1D n=1 Tax=Zingiber officinale TaxID=94328 RepID=A0A8J5CH64_ZINOF|nr:nuclear nucleic acid-binding protein C1D-like [Zingiber officinale]XP_042443211.1 nuclear nucleic acid-binding protein C1D-like [Zingiber officinale]KAG6474666.1 hypothetical protein ZIOFF_068604 [Zingiber officinale]